MNFRDALHEDLDPIVALLADDALGQSRERYDSRLQITMIPNLSHQGGWRAQIEGVRVAPRAQGQGIGRAMFEHAIELANTKGCRMVQLTTDRSRPEALAFYESLGFTHSHAGMKLALGGN